MRYLPPVLAVVILIVFATLPWLAIGEQTVTGLQTSQALLPQFPGQVMWLIPLAAIVTIIGIRLTVARLVGVTLTALSLIAFIWYFVYVQQGLTVPTRAGWSLLGIGYWGALLSTVISVIAGIVEWRRVGN